MSQVQSQEVTDDLTVGEFQVMPDLEAEEFRALKEDIDENGVRVPIAIDEDGNVIDGAHRTKACRELGIEPPTAQYSGLDESEKISMAWTMNMQRRHLDSQDKKTLIRERINQLIERGEHKTDQDIADEMGVTQPWVSKVRKTVVEDKYEEQESSEDGEGGQNITSYDLSTVSDFATSEQKRGFIKDILVDNPDKSDRSIGKSIGSSHRTVASVRDKLTTVWRPQLIQDDAHDVLSRIPDESVDLIVTDPPYGIAFDGQRYDTAMADKLEGDDDHNVLEGIAEEFYRVLSEDSHCYVFTRWDVYPAVLELFSDVFDVDTLIVWDKDEGGHGMGDLEDWAPRHEFIIKLSKGSRPVNGKRKPNVIRHQDARFTDDNKSHPTQKPVGLLEELIEASSNKEEVVADFFGGSYSTPQAAVKLGRKAVACEIDVDHHADGRERVNELVEKESGQNTMVRDVEVVE